MKIIIQDLRSGKTKAEEIPCPSPQKGEVLIKSKNSLLSVGTERMLVDFGKSNLIQKALSQPERVKQVIDKLKKDGILPTLESVLNKLNTPLPLGYCNAGEILELGSGVNSFKIGDRVVSNGHHSNGVSCPENLVAKIPDNLTFEEASFTVMCSIALQGVRLSKPTIGETFVVYGLGLVGLLAVQILIANGCRVIGIDYDEERLELARKFGAQPINLNFEKNPVDFVKSLSNNNGADGVLIATATESNDPISNSAKMVRKLGRIILIGATGLNISRDDFYEKEITFQVSASYGPGRYDPTYEEKGVDYPLGYVRWTEKRNFLASLELISSGKIDVKSLISHRFKFEDFQDAYDLMENKTPSLGIVFKYEDNNKFPKSLEISNDLNSKKLKNTKPNFIGMIGAGEYAKKVLIPSLVKNNAYLHTIVSKGGLSSSISAKKYNFNFASSDPKQIIEDKDIKSIMIATRHDSHAEFVIDSLNAGKNVFVEKPLCINDLELSQIKQTYLSLEKKPVLMVGFNRRYSPLIKSIKDNLEISNEPKSIIMTINAGKIESNSWIQDQEIGGGRFIGEGCHFIDLLMYLVNSKLEDFSVAKLDTKIKDTASISLSFEDGSIGTIHYFTNGHNKIQKERMEIYSGGKIIQLDNFRSLKAYGWKGLKNINLFKQNKGQNECVRAFLDACEDGFNENPIEFNQLFSVHDICLKIQNS